MHITKLGYAVKKKNWIWTAQRKPWRDNLNRRAAAGVLRLIAYLLEIHLLMWIAGNTSLWTSSGSSAALFLFTVLRGRRTHVGSAQACPAHTGICASVYLWQPVSLHKCCSVLLSAGMTQSQFTAQASCSVRYPFLNQDISFVWLARPRMDEMANNKIKSKNQTV